MKIIHLLLLCFLAIPLFGQAPKKLSKLIGEGFVELAGEPTYPWRPVGDVQFYPSWTQQGDTTGASNNCEFLMFRDSNYFEQGELFKFVRDYWVTNGEYGEFLDWVQDSIFRELIYRNNDPTGNDEIPEEDLAEMLVHPDIFFSPSEMTEVEFDPSNVYSNRFYFPFNWEQPWYKNIRANQSIPLISPLYLRPNDRLNKAKEFDDKEWWFSMNKYGRNSVLVTEDRDIWAINSEHPFDLEYNIANYYYRDYAFYDMPVLGLLGTQIKAYLLYLERDIQQQMGEAKLAYRVRVSLPTPTEILQENPDYKNKRWYLITSEVDLTERWKITNADYQSFLYWVQDSLCREKIYQNNMPSWKKDLDQESITEMLWHPEVYYDEVNLAWSEFDPSQPFINHMLFPFDWNFDWQKKFTPDQYVPLIQGYYGDSTKVLLESGELNKDGFDPTAYWYRYEWKDIKRKSIEGELIWNEKKGEYECVDGDTWACRELSMDVHLKDTFNCGVRRNSNYGDFIIHEAVLLYPGFNCQDCNEVCMHEHGEAARQSSECKKCPDFEQQQIEIYDFKTNPEELIQTLTYAQAMAYYHWKYLRHTPWTNSDGQIYDDLVPTEEEFRRIQKGESIILPSQNLTFPTPCFRYVIHVYPK